MASVALPALSEAAVNEIIVTAQKREQALQDVAMSVTALTGDVLEDLGAVNLYDYAATVPGLVISTPQPGFGTVIIRGISDGILGGETAATAAIYIDEMPITSKVSNPDLKLFDLERVEVLRGPQGTLYGVSSMGGTLRVVTAKPDADDFATEFAATAQTTKDGGLGYNFNGMVNVPLVEGKLAARLVGYYYDEEGWIDNSTTGSTGINDEQTWGGRLSVRFTPTENLSVTGMVIHQDQELGAPFAVNPDLGSDLLINDAFVDEPRTEEFTSYNLTVDWDLGLVNVVSSTSYFERDGVNIDDETIALVNATGGLFPGPTTGDNFSKREVFVQEVRLSSTHEGPLQWILGGFYQKEDVDFDQCITTQNGEAIITGIGFGALVLPDAPNCVFNFQNDSTFKTTAVFGELAYDVTEKFKATFGARWFSNKTSDDIVQNGLLNGGRTTNSLKSDESDVNLRFLLSYDVTPDFLLYAQAAQGFRQGGLAGAVPDRPATEFTSDSLWNYEIGAKTGWFDNRLTANASLYYINWSDIQIQQQTPGGFAFIGNGGDASILGFEGELFAQPIEGLDLSASINLADPEFGDDQPTINAGPDVVDISNGQLPGVPRVTLSGSAQYVFPLPIGDGLDGMVRGDIRYIGENFAGPGPFFKSTRQGDYALVNLRTGIQGDNWEVTLFAENVANKRARVLSMVIPSLGFNHVWTNTPRTIGITLRARY